MENLRSVLVDSFRMMVNRPVLFVPRLVSTSFSSVVFILLAMGEISQQVFLLSFPVILLLGGFVPVIVSAMVKIEGENILRNSIKESLKLWKQVVGLIGLIFFISLINSIPISLGMAGYIITQNIIYPVIGGIISLVILIAVTFGLYFVPISIVKRQDLFGSLKEGFNTSRQNSKEVMILTLFSLAIFIISALLESGNPQNIGFALFFIGRITSAIVATYLLVISPQYYLSQGEEK